MCRKFYYVHPKVLCSSYVAAVFQRFCRFLDVRSIVFLAVNYCLKGVFGGVVGHGKSPCFLWLSVLTTAGLGDAVSVFKVADGVFFHD